MAVERITVADEVTLRIAFRKSFDNLLTGPFGGWMFGDPRVKNSSPPMLDHQEHEQYPQADRRHREEIDRDDLSDMIL